MFAKSSFYVVGILAVFIVNINTQAEGRFNAREEAEDRAEKVKYILDVTVKVASNVPPSLVQRLNEAGDYCRGESSTPGKRNYADENDYYLRRSSRKSDEEYLNHFKDFLNSLPEEQLDLSYKIAQYLETAPLDGQIGYVYYSIAVLNHCGDQRHGQKRNQLLRALLNKNIK